MSSVSSSSDNEEITGQPTRVSTWSSTRRIQLQSSSPLTGAEPDDDTTSGGADLATAGTSTDYTPERPPCPDDSCPGSLGPICSVLCAVKDFTASPTAQEQCLHHHRMQQDVAHRLASSRVLRTHASLGPQGGLKLSVPFTAPTFLLRIPRTWRRLIHISYRRPIAIPSAP